ncbi:pitrilysin family protein [Fulvimonas sp. R45]|uniref:M16 family metallopeptidase n=1 Tax=Fulvimonas sp. R45 TaxID=3045937 RepID=UPI00266039E8|nr:pitrilysin family protein [Fulvimonas sp. R45]MDO1528385.1 pitrilysin family protein [Fulvimonas sp. R45]
MTARTTLAAGLLSGLMTLATGAQAASPPAERFPGEPPPPGPAPVLRLPVPQQHTLANGLQVVVARREGLPLVTAHLIVRAGSETDPAGEAGLAALTATLLTRGAGGMGAPEIAAAAEALGGSLDAGSGWDESDVDITVTTPKLPAALKLMSTVVEHPDFAQDELDRARKQTADDLRLRLSRPTGMAALLAQRAVFGDGAYGHSAMGTPQSLPRIARADVVRQHATWYRPDNAILVLAGDIDLATATRLAETAFGGWKAPAAALPAKPAGVGKGDAPALLVVDQKGAGQAGVVAAHLGIRRGDADFYAGEVANAVLGGSYSARLNEEIRIKRGLSYGASSRLDARRDPGQWMAVVQTKNPSAAQVVQLVGQEFDRLAQAPVPAAELAARKATLVGGYGRSLETTGGLAAQVGELALYGVPLDAVGQYIRRVQAVTPAQVQAFARAHLGDAGTRVVVVGDAAQFGAALKRTHPRLEQVEYDAVRLDAPH